MEHSPILHLDEWEIPRENIVLNRKLGEGAFGAVCGGEVMGIGGEGEWVPVAVKSLKIGSLPEDKVCNLLISAVKRDTFAKLNYRNKRPGRLNLVPRVLSNLPYRARKSFPESLSLSRSVERVGENPGNEVGGVYVSIGIQAGALNR